MHKKAVLIIAVLVMCMGASLPVHAGQGMQPRIELDGKALDARCIVEDGRLFIPLRAVCEAAGYEVRWHEPDRIIQLNRPGNHVELRLRDLKVIENGHGFFMLDDYRMVDGRTYLQQGFVADYLGLNVDLDSSKMLVSLAIIKTNPIIIDNVREAAQEGSLQLEIQYPQLRGLEYPEIQDTINAAYREQAMGAKVQGLKNWKELQGSEAARHWVTQTYFNYAVKYNSNDILSVVFTDYQYSGGAHGGTIQKSYTYNLKTGDLYAISDLFADGYDYTGVISGMVKNQMEEREINYLLRPFNAIRADQDYYLANNGLVVYFQQYEYLPYAYGIPEFVIDYAVFGAPLMIPRIQ